MVYREEAVHSQNASTVNISMSSVCPFAQSITASKTFDLVTFLLGFPQLGLLVAIIS